jgi:hypothetical protein
MISFDVPACAFIAKRYLLLKETSSPMNPAVEHDGDHRRRRRTGHALKLRHLQKAVRPDGCRRGEEPTQVNDRPS